MTDEVEAISGELELLTRVTPDGGIEAMVRHAGARDLSTVSGSPTHSVAVRPSRVEHRAAHDRILETLTMPDRVEGGNEMPVGLLED